MFSALSEDRYVLRSIDSKARNPTYGPTLGLNHLCDTLACAIYLSHFQVYRIPSIIQSLGIHNICLWRQTQIQSTNSSHEGYKKSSGATLSRRSSQKGGHRNVTGVRKHNVVVIN